MSRPKEPFVCAICQGTFEQFGNNPDPFEGDRCCNECDQKYVIPARIQAMTGRGLDAVQLRRVSVVASTERLRKEKP